MSLLVATPYSGRMQDLDGRIQRPTWTGIQDAVYHPGMQGTRTLLKGGCLCGAVRYEAQGEPLSTGFCYCADCRKASGSGFIPFMAFSREALSFSGRTLQYRSRSARGTEALRNSCPHCGGLVYGGDVAKDKVFTIYAGSLDDPSFFQPRIAIFTRDRPSWVFIPPGLTLFEGLPS
jgi:hypothetical protein